MFCWQVRRRYADLMESGHDPSLSGARAHVDACQDCRDELQALSGVAEIVGAEARAWPGTTPLTDPVAFERAVFSRARATQRDGSQGPASRIEPSIPRWRGLVPTIASAAAIMTLAVATSLFVGTPAPEGILPTHVAVEDWPDQEQASDLLAPPREIPFMIREDLVGARTGTIPATTYVLEPAPVENAVMRASL